MPVTPVPEGGAPLLPGWESIRVDYIQPKLPGRVVIRANPKLELFVDLGARRFGATMALPKGSIVPPSPFEDLEITEIRDDEVRCIEISTRAAGLFGTFYLFVVDIFRAVLEQAATPVAALEASLKHWRALLQTAALLSPEKQLGLLGELWLLERLCSKLGQAGLAAWVGPNGEGHDFRLGGIEIEVKTTSGARRVHQINGLGQLAPTPEARLYLLSLRFVDAGSSGETLGEAIGRLARKIASDERGQFEDKLEKTGFRSSDASHYARRWRMADRPRLIMVQHGVPRLTAEALESVPAGFATSGISDVSYRIDVEGMGWEEGTSEFHSVIPA